MHCKTDFLALRMIRDRSSSCFCFCRLTDHFQIDRIIGSVLFTEMAIRHMNTHEFQIPDAIFLTVLLVASWAIAHFFAACIVYYAQLCHLPEIIQRLPASAAKPRWRRGYLDTQQGMYFCFDDNFVYITSWDLWLPFLPLLTGIARVPFDQVEFPAEDLMLIKVESRTFQARPAGLYPAWPESALKRQSAPVLSR